jgi:xanthine dehydrogenase YagR molybdenum-binding subunit
MWVTTGTAFYSGTARPRDPHGHRGIDEFGNVGTAAAVASAVYHATGVRVRDLPIRLEKLMSA